MTLIKQIENWFKDAVPEPTDDNRRVQLGCHLEEVGEMCETISMTTNKLTFSSDTKKTILNECNTEEPILEKIEIVGFDKLSKRLKKGNHESKYSIGRFYRENYSVIINDKVGLTDALADQIVTAIGLAYMHGIDIEGALNEVNRSNWSKFVDGKPVFDENGKIKKGDGYTPPELSKFVEE